MTLMFTRSSVGCRRWTSVLIAKTFPLHLILELAVEDAAVYDGLDFIVLLMVHNYWQWWGVCLLTWDWICNCRPEFDNIEY